MTNAGMGSRLVANVQARNTIEGLVHTDAITGAKAKRWNDRIQVEATRHEALHAGGERAAAAMFRLGVWYQDGEMGLTECAVTAFDWFKRGTERPDHLKSHARCLFAMAEALIGGHGAPRNQAHGVGLLFSAAHLGSQAAALRLARMYEAGEHGLPCDAFQARKWYLLFDGRCRHKDASEADAEFALSRARALGPVVAARG